MGNSTSKWCAILLPLTLAVSQPAMARQYEMVVPGYQPLLTSDGQVPTAARVKAAIVDAAQQKSWEITASAPGKLTLRYAPRTHEVIVAVRYDDRGFRIEYISSKEMDYESKKGKTYIHGNYNVWVGNLAESIATSRILLPEDERNIAMEYVAPVPVRYLKLSAPVHIQAALSYPPGFADAEALQGRCDWNRQFSERVVRESDGLVQVADGDPAKLSGYALKLSVLNMRAVDGGGFSGPKWVVLRTDLYDSGRLIGRVNQRRITNTLFNSACSALDKIAEALAHDTVEWLQRGQFEVRTEVFRPLPEIGQAEDVPSIQ